MRGVWHGLVRGYGGGATGWLALRKASYQESARAKNGIRRPERGRRAVSGFFQLHQNLARDLFQRLEDSHALGRYGLEGRLLPAAKLLFQLLDA